jgi:hypothetical protein
MVAMARLARATPGAAPAAALAFKEHCHHPVAVLA